MDEMDTAENLEKRLAQADVVAVCLPGTRETFHLFSERQFAAMKEGAVFLNVGRGNIVDTEALVKVLKEGKLWGASLDVFEQEPLPEDSELWSCPNLLITPHVSGGFHLPYTVDRIVEISLKNLAAYIHHEEYVSVVDRATGYKVSGSL
jgi:phosphoglycerate dehydrogenase-like enzyme